jgi:hypothetical protein
VTWHGRRCSTPFRLACGTICIALACTSVEAQATPDYPRTTRITGQLRLGGRLDVLTQGLDKALADSLVDLGSLVLFVNDRPVQTIVARSGAADAITVLVTDSDTNRVIVRQATNYAVTPRATVRTGLGTAALGPFPWSDGRIRATTIELYAPLRLALIVAGMLLGWLLARWAGGVAALLEEPGNGGAAWSLARWQAATWFAVIYLSFLFLYAVTGELNTSITGQSLVLMGISGATGAMGAAIGQGKADAAARVLRSAGVTRVVAAASPASQPLEVQRALGRLGKPGGGGFLSSVLNDASGPTVYRLQLLLWTCVIAAIYLWEVWHRLAVPQFSTNVLMLVGISGGTYLGFKVPEDQGR